MEKELAQSDITVRRKVPKTTWNGPKMAQNGQKPVCCSLPKWLVPRNSWVALALRHPTQHLWTNFEIWANPNFGPRTPKKGQKPVWLLWLAKMVGSVCVLLGGSSLKTSHPAYLNQFFDFGQPQFWPRGGQKCSKICPKWQMVWGQNSNFFWTYRVTYQNKREKGTKLMGK